MADNSWTRAVGAPANSPTSNPLLTVNLTSPLAGISPLNAAIAKEKGIPLEDTGPFPVKIVVNGSEQEAVSALQELGAKFEATAPKHRMSALQDLERGQHLEIDDTLGHAVDEARQLGIPAPTLEMCYSLCKGINRYL